MIHKTQAIVLRLAPYSNTSRVVTWMCPNHGRVATLIKGALRPRSLFLGQLDLFYTCELLYHRRDDREVFIARECAPIRIRPTLRRSWKACATASYLADLVSRLVPAHSPQEILFDELNRIFDELDERGTSPGLLFWIELRFLHLLGLAPRLGRCVGCQCDLETPGTPSALSFARGGLLCATCARLDPHPAQRIPPDVLAMLRRWQAAPDAGTARRIRCEPRQLVLMESLLGQFIRYHLDLPLPSRDIAFSILQR